jgi:hypothetical protein
MPSAVEIKLKIAHDLQKHLNLPDIIPVQGESVGECLKDAARLYPQLGSWNDDQDGLVRKFILLNKDIALAPTPINLSRRLKSDDELTLLAIFAGG